MSAQNMFITNSAAVPVSAAQPAISRLRKNGSRLLGLTALAMSMAACNTIPKVSQTIS